MQTYRVNLSDGSGQRGQRTLHAYNDTHVRQQAAELLSSHARIEVWQGDRKVCTLGVEAGRS